MINPQQTVYLPSGCASECVQAHECVALFCECSEVCVCACVCVCVRACVCVCVCVCAEEDELENVEMAEQKKRAAAYRAAKKTSTIAEM